MASEIGEISVSKSILGASGHKICKLLYPGRPSFLAHSAAAPTGHAGAPPVHYRACFGPSRAPWRGLSASKVARAGPLSKECVPPRRAAQDLQNPRVQLFKMIVFVRLLLYLHHTALQPLYFAAGTVQQRSHFKVFRSSHRPPPRTVLLRMCHAKEHIEINPPFL